MLHKETVSHVNENRFYTEFIQSHTVVISVQEFRRDLHIALQVKSENIELLWGGDCKAEEGLVTIASNSH